MVGEVGAAVAWRDRGERRPGGFERGLLEGERPGRLGDLRRRQPVPGEVEQRRRQVFRGGEALVEGPGREHAFQEVGRDGFAGLVVDGVVLQHLRPGGPHLVHLRGVLHEVARHRSAGEGGIADRGEQSVEGVAELVEQGDDFVEGQQRRLAFRRFGDVQVVRHDRFRPEEARLRDIGVHPGAAPFRGPGVEVAEEQAERRPVLLEDLPDADIGVVGGKIGALLEPEAVEAGGGVEDAVLQNAVHFEVGLQLRFVEVEALRAQFLRVVRPIPGGDVEVVPLGASERLQRVPLPPGVRHGRRREAGQPFVDGFQGLRGLFLEDEGGVVRVAEQGRPFGAERGDADDDFPVVALAPAAAPGEGRLHDPLPERAILQ